MKKLLALLLSGLCVLSVAACGGEGGESNVNASSTGGNGAQEKSEFEKIRAFLENTSDAENADLVYEIIMGHQGVKLMEQESIACQFIKEVDGVITENYLATNDKTITGEVVREGLDEESPYKAKVSINNNQTYNIEAYEDGSGLYIPANQIKYDSVGLKGLINQIPNLYCSNAKETFSMNAHLSESSLAQIGISYSMETVGDSTTIIYKDSLGEQQTQEGETMTVSASRELKWIFDKDYRCVEYSENVAYVYTAAVAEETGKETGSEIFTVQAWDGTVTLPSDVSSYYAVGSFMGF